MNEIYDRLSQHVTIQKKNVQANLHARFRELEDMGLIRRLGTKKCSITDQTVTEWDISITRPKEVKQARIKRKEKLINDLRLHMAKINVPYIYTKQIVEYLDAYRY